MCFAMDTEQILRYGNVQRRKLQLRLTVSERTRETLEG